MNKVTDRGENTAYGLDKSEKLLSYVRKVCNPWQSEPPRKKQFRGGSLA